LTANSRTILGAHGRLATLTLSKTSFKNVARDSAVDAEKKIFRPIKVTDFWHKLGLHFEPAR